MARIPLIAVCAALAVSLAAPARADLPQAVQDVILPAYDRLAASSAALAQAAQDDCQPQALEQPYQAVWDDWARIDFLRLGPVETGGRALAISFWPDPKSSGRRAQQALIASAPATIDDPDAFARLSVAMRGLTGLERLIFAPRLDGDDEVLCRLRRATATDLARNAAAIRAEWDGFAPLLLEPGGAGNTSFLNATESRQALFTQIVTGLEYTADTRLGRPMGSFDKPRPERAEALAAGRSQRNVVESLRGMRDLTLALHPDAPRSRAGFDRALALAEALDDPVFAGAADPQKRLHIEVLQQAIKATREAVQAEIGGALGLSVGFNAKDGD
ncbi:imelysin family protein [Paracoccus jiaweipingae]|uniref:imelysin family protein n=1 Tax=unclassified Paracoccus (in: a-proteobacteria) TaxID=2688777 RepID=UPI00379BDA74